MKANSVIDLIGNTPHLRLNHLYNDVINEDVQAEIWYKLERSNPGGSIKDRIALQMILDAEESGYLSNDTVIIEPTSGNTGIGLSMVAAVKGYRLILVMPESMSIERRKIMRAYGAEISLTPKEEGIPGAIRQANELCTKLKSEGQKVWIPQQFTNPSNIKAHSLYTATEIIKDFPQGIDYLITGVGTGGHISGCAKVLKKHFPQLKVLAVEPEKSPVISGGSSGSHRIQGIGAGFIPENYQSEYVDGVITVSEEESFEFAARMAKEEGVLVGISSGATLAAINKQIKQLKSESPVILGFCYDTGERYLSIDGLF